MCSSQALLYISMSSRYAITNLSELWWNTLLTILMKDTGAFVRPNGTTRSSNLSYVVLKAVLDALFSRYSLDGIRFED